MQIIINDTGNKSRTQRLIDYLDLNFFDWKEDVSSQSDKEQKKFECYEILQVRAGNRFTCGEQCKECEEREKNTQDN